MKTYTDLENDILAYIQNANIVKNSELSTLLSSLVERVQFDVNEKASSYKGIAISTTNPGSPSGLCFYIATAAGTYNNFKDVANQSLVLTAGLNILSYTGVFWEKALFSVDLSSYETSASCDRRFNYPFHDGATMVLNASLRAIIKDAWISGANMTKTYYIKQLTYHTSGNNFVIQVWDKETPQMVSLFTSASWNPGFRYQEVVCDAYNSSGITVKLLIKTDELSAALNITGLTELQSQLSPRTYEIFRSLFLANYPKMKGTLSRDFTFTDGILSLYDSGGNKSSLLPGNEMSGKGAFVGVADNIKVRLVGLAATDVIVATPSGAIVNNNDILVVETRTDEFYVRRLTGGTSNLAFNWIRIVK